MFITILTYWYNKQLAKVPDANDLLLNKVSSVYLQNYIQAVSDQPASYTKQEGIYSVTHSATGTSFYIEIFRSKCIDIRVNATPYNFGTNSYTFSIPKSSLGGAVSGQNANLTFISYFISNTLDFLASEMEHFKYLIYRTAIRRNHRYGVLSISDFGYAANPTKEEVLYIFQDCISLENLNINRISVNINANDSYIMEWTGEIELNLVNKIDSTLVYNSETCKNWY